jgi:hypothetical protein
MMPGFFAESTERRITNQRATYKIVTMGGDGKNNFSIIINVQAIGPVCYSAALITF